MVHSLEKHYKINANRLEKQYKYHLSDYHSWNQKDHAQEWILFLENIDPYLNLNEKSLSEGELYTILTYKQAKSKKGYLVTMIKETKAENIIQIIEKLSEDALDSMREVTLDIANWIKT